MVDAAVHALRLAELELAAALRRARKQGVKAWRDAPSGRRRELRFLRPFHLGGHAPSATAAGARRPCRKGDEFRVRKRKTAALCALLLLAAAVGTACGAAQSPVSPDAAWDRDGIPMQPAPPPSAWDRARAWLVPATVYGEVVPSEEGRARYELVCSMTTAYALRGLFLDLKRYAGKKVVARGYIRGAGGRGRPVFWAVRIVPLDPAGAEG